jgi:serpin B
MIPMQSLRLFPVLLIATTLIGAAANTLFAESPEISPAINALGLDLYRAQAKSAGDDNLLLSPYSIATALAMTYAGADGVTFTEMQQVLHFSKGGPATGEAFQALSRQLTQVVSSSERQVAAMKQRGADTTPIQLLVANRLYLQQGFALRPAFLAQLAERFESTLEEVDFSGHPDQTRIIINRWIADHTKGKIQDMVPKGLPVPTTRLALVNALYLKASWQKAFDADETKPDMFFLRGRDAVQVPTMFTIQRLGFAQRGGYKVVSLPYLGEELQLVLLVPDQPAGLGSLEQSLTTDALAECTRLTYHEVRLHLPKFKLELPTMKLGKSLQSLGLKTAFDLPAGSANFEGMAPRKPDDYLYIGEVLHKTWLALDENGTEAAAATVVLMRAPMGVGPRNEPPPIEVRVDRPFLFAIQHVSSGTCLFLGRVTDPR